MGRTPASSAILACSAVVTSIIIPPFAICANPALSLNVPVTIKGTSNGPI